MIEEKSKKDKLWKIEATVKTPLAEEFKARLEDMPHSYQTIGKHTIFNIYCATQAESAKVKDLIQEYGAKYVALESKTL